MDIKTEYYTSRYEDLSVLSDTDKCKTVLVKNTDTGELAVRKTMDINAYKIYNALKDIRNRNLAQIYECFTVDNKCVVFEEYINGKRMDSIIASNEIDVYRAVEYEMQLCNALLDIHNKGIIHRDIQPKNIIVTNDGVIKLIDFDIARQEKIGVSKDTEFWGTAGYAAPEQYGFAQTNERSDIYSMGVLLCAMITGKEDGDLASVRTKESFQKNKVNFTKIEHIITKCTEMDSRNRYSSVEELLLELRKSISQYSEEKEQTKEHKTEEKLPKLTWKYVLRTIPGLKSGNIIYEIFALCIYGVLLWAFGFAGWTLPVLGIKKIYAVIMYEAFFIIPYMYLANIAHIAQRFPKMSFKTKFSRILYQISTAIVVMILLVIIMAFTLPVTANNK